MANLTAVTEGLERDGLDMLHFDVMDGQFVPNITFGMPVLAAVDHCTNLFPPGSFIPPCKSCCMRKALL